MKKIILASLLSLFLLIPFGKTCVAGDTINGYSMPITAPMYLSPPVSYKNNKVMVVLFQTTSEVIQKLVPQPLTPNKKNLMIVYVGTMNIKDPIDYSYKEMGIVIPVIFSDTQGNYVPYMYLDKTMPVVGGREVWGFPKKDADIEFLMEKNQIEAKVMRNGSMLMKASLKLTEQLETIPKRPSIPWFNLKIIPSIKKNARPVVKQLTSTPTNQDVKEKHWGKAEFEFGSSLFDPLGDIEIIKTLKASYNVSDSILGYGDVIYDYLSEEK